MRPRRFFSSSHAAISIATLSFFTAGANATSFASTWVGTAGDWTDPTNWSSDPVFPNNTGTASFKASINSSNANVNLDRTITVGQLLLNTGTLSGDGVLNVTENMAWLQGALHGDGTINVTGDALDIFGAGRRFSRYTINTAANTTTTWISGLIRSTSLEAGAFNNSGTFDSQTDAAWTWELIETSIFNNKPGAIFKKTDGLNRQELQPAFNNSGTVSVESGGLWFSGGGTSEGTFLVSAGARLSFSDFHQDLSSANAPTTTFLAGSVIKSSGTVSFINSFGDATNDIGGKIDTTFLTIDPGPGGNVRLLSSARAGSNNSGDLLVTSGTLILQSGAAGTFNSATISGGAHVALSAGGSAILSAKSLSIDADNGGFLNIGDNKVIIDYTGASSAASIRSLIITGRAGGSWNGNGITSSSAAAVAAGLDPHKTAVGYAEASELGVTTFAGQPVDGSALLLRYTYLGDANLDGKVNALDLNAVANNFGTAAGNLWSHGDFNYDGTTNTADFTALGTNFGLVLASPPALRNPLGALVPEPATPALLATTFPWLSRRRSRRCAAEG